MKRTRMLSLGITVLCLTAVPVMADMVDLDISYHPLQGSYNVSTKFFTVSTGVSSWQFGVVSSGPSSYATNLDQFSLKMLMNSTGSGTGTLRLTDNDGDYIEGTVTGTWKDMGAQINLPGAALTNVRFFGAGVDKKFTGTTSTMSIPANSLYGDGWINVGLLGTTKWFDATTNWTTAVGGSADGTVVAVPIPGAVLLGFLGLGAAGLGLRRLA